MNINEYKSAASRNLSSEYVKAQDNIIAESKKQEQKQKRRILECTLAGLAVAGAATALGIMIYKGKIPNPIKKINTKNINIKDNLANNEQIKTAINKNKLLSEVDFKNIPKETFTIKDYLKSGDLIEMEYVDGVLKKSIRTGKVNFTKTYETINGSKHKITIFDSLKNSCREIILEEKKEAAIKSQEELKALFEQKDNLFSSEFENKAKNIRFRSKKQNEEIAEILKQKKQVFLDEKKAFFDKYVVGCSDTSSIECSYNKLTEEQFDVLKKISKNKLADYDYSSFCYIKKCTLESPNFIYELSNIKDVKTLKRLSQLADGNMRNYYDKMFKISSLDDVAFKRVQELFNIGYKPCLVKPQELGKMTDIEYGRLKEMIEKNMQYYNNGYKNVVFLNDEFYQRAVGIMDNYGLDLSHYPEILNLPQKEFAKIQTLIEKGCPAHMLKSFSETEYKNLLTILDSGIYSSVPDEVLQSTEKCLEFISEQKAMSSKMYKLADLDRPEIRQEIAESLNKQFYSHYTADDININMLAQEWKKEYIKGGGIGKFSDECERKFLELTCKSYETQAGEPLARWMRFENPQGFIRNFPEVGETYCPQRIQSCAKTLDGAEIYRGNNFSDLNTNMNVKFVIKPKSKVTGAFDIGMGKYGADEAIYPPGQEFTVLDKKWETIINHGDGRRHKLYTIYLGEK